MGRKRSIPSNRIARLRGSVGGSTPTILAEQQARAFFGIGIAIHLFGIEHSFGLGFNLPAADFFVHKWDGVAWQIYKKISLGTGSSRGINAVKFENFEGQLDTEPQKSAWWLDRLTNITSAFSSGTKGEPILLAGQWLFDSSTGQEELLNFIQAMVALEILLGEKSASDEMGLGQLLRNRCAYLIGKNNAERAMLLKQFDEIYNVRSQIVHRGKARLNASERWLFARLKQIGSLVIAKEIDLLRADPK